MKNFAFIFFFFLSINSSDAQTLNDANIDAIKKQVEAKAKTFCKYVVAVGTSPGQKGAVSEEVKNDIVRNQVPGLFYEYYEAPRVMITSYANGSKTRKRKMSDYFSNLKRQSNTGINSARRYELRYVGISSNGDLGGFRYSRTTSDGCKLYVATIIIRQLYHKIDLNSPNADDRAVEKIEDESKVYEVYALVKPNGKAGVFLGDVKRMYKN